MARHHVARHMASCSGLDHDEPIKMKKKTCTTGGKKIAIPCDSRVLGLS
jgi:hypothetical protein